MKYLNRSHFIGIWTNKNMPPNWNYPDQLEITIYSYERFSIMINGEASLLVEGELTVKNLQNDVFALNIDGAAIDETYLHYTGRMYLADKIPSFVLTIPGYGERYFERSRK